MFSYSAAHLNSSIDPPPAYPGAPPDAERAKKPPLPEPPYQPYREKPGVPVPYKPYAEKPQPGHPYEPYPGI